MALTSLGNAAHKLSAHIGTWPRAAVFSVGIAVGLSIGGPAAASAAVESWTRGPRRRRGDRRRLEAAPPTDKEPYPYDAIEGGAHLDTPLGRTRYYDCGPRDGVKVVLIHGVSTPSNIWRHAIPILVKQGFRVLAYVSRQKDRNVLCDDVCIAHVLTYRYHHKRTSLVEAIPREWMQQALAKKKYTSISSAIW